MSKLIWFSILLTCLALVGTFSLSAYGGGGGAASNITGQCDEEVCTVEMINSSFTPDTLIVHPFTKITWINKDEAFHTVTSEPTGEVTGPMSSELLKKGESYTITFEEPGEYKYSCQAHKGMMGTILVQGEPLPELPEIALYIAITGTFASMIVITRFRKNQFKSLYNALINVRMSCLLF